MEGPIVAAGLSGHGFEIAPAVGELVADLVVECHVDSHSGDPRIPAGLPVVAMYRKRSVEVAVSRCRGGPDALDSELMSNVPLLRNKSGTARDRDPHQPVEELEFEAAIGRNVRKLRLAQGLTVADMATRVGISKAMLSKIENAQTSCSLSTLALLAKGLDVPVTSLFRGADVERQAVFVKAGTGARVARNGTTQGHEYQLLGSLRGEHKRLECLLVTLSKKSTTHPLFQHSGTEFIFMLDGVMDYSHSRSVYRLHPGDTLQIDGEGAHGPVDLVKLPIRFLSVIAFPDSQI